MHNDGNLFYYELRITLPSLLFRDRMRTLSRPLVILVIATIRFSDPSYFLLLPQPSLTQFPKVLKVG
jgi:hypothetical protein